MKRQKSVMSSWPYFTILLSGVFLWPMVIGSPTHAQETADFMVIVNASNPLSTMSRKQMARIFLKKEERWGNGFAITVVDQTVDQPTRQVFSKAVLLKDPKAVEAYWRKLIFSGMGSPPLKLVSDAEVMSFVGSNVGSIGYVSGETELSAAVKELEVTP